MHYDFQTILGPATSMEAYRELSAASEIAASCKAENVTYLDGRRTLKPINSYISHEIAQISGPLAHTGQFSDPALLGVDAGLEV